MNPETLARECQLRSDLLRSKDVSPKDFKQNYIITFLLEQASFDNNLRKKQVCDEKQEVRNAERHTFQGELEGHGNKIHVVSNEEVTINYSVSAWTRLRSGCSHDAIC